VFLPELDDLGAIPCGGETRFDTFEAIDRLAQAAFQAFKR
jgi:hypothetical protein